jgi:transposase InsO family protein
MAATDATAESHSTNQRWAMDFVTERLYAGRWFRVLTVVDQFTRECLLLLADSSLTGHKVTLALSRVIAERDAPESITVDNGTGRSVIQCAVPDLVVVFAPQLELLGGASHGDSRWAWITTQETGEEFIFNIFSG